MATILAMQPLPHGVPSQGRPSCLPFFRPIHTTSSTPPTSSGKKRRISLQSILNPEKEPEKQQRDQCSVSQRDTPNSQNFLTGPTSANSTRLHTQKANLLHSSPETIHVQQSPFLTTSTYPLYPMLPHQPLHTPPAGQRRSYFPPVSNSSPALARAVASTELHPPTAGFPQSVSSRPLAQHFPYSPPASVVRSQRDMSSAMHDLWSFAGPKDTEHIGTSMAPSGQSSIVLMTITSQREGYNVQIPVEVQSAPKAAEEKRKRNAGASARFRVKRKEKERQALISISRLEQQLHNTIEDARFYRRERNRYRDLYLQQHPDIPGKLSPRLSRPSLRSLPTSPAVGTSEDSYGDCKDEVCEKERNIPGRSWY
jgi:hypothetical protein